MAQKGHGGGDAYHGLVDKGKDGEKSDRLGIYVWQMNLVMGKHGVEEGGEGGPDRPTRHR